MKFLSVCSGIEAASVAWSGLGWKASAFAEIEAFPSAVLAHHYPSVPNLGDMTKIARGILTGEVEAPDLLCGGTPCQAFSVAGLRASLGDARGGLTLKFVELADAIDFVRARSGRPPSIVFWENVPGVLNTKDNAFGCFLGALVGESEALEPSGEKWTDAGCVYGPTRAVAWRVLDAQYFGLAQRRRRVFVVASARNGFDPAEVLFERDGVRRDSAPSREQGQDTAGCLASRTDGGGFPGTDEACSGYVQPVTAFGGNRTSGSIEVSPALLAQPGSGWKGDFESETFLVQPTAHTLRGEGFDASEDGTGRGMPLVPVHCREVAQTITSNYGKQVDNSDTALGPNVVAMCIHADAVGRTGNAVTPSPDAEGRVRLRNPGMGLIGDGTAYNLMANGQPHAVVAFDTTQITSAANYSNPQAGDPCYPLAAGAHPPAIAFPANLSGTQCASTEEVAPSMGAMNPTAVAVALRGREGGATAELGDEVQNCLRASSGGGDKPHVLAAMQVRRLTPRECEALQGFPQDYTAIPWRKKPASECPDGPRYKALGNSWAVPVVAWIGRRIDAALKRLEPA